eukprot:CAMPEP_0194406762 /NCGR_PEP_ID=MMETSP0176-20130528/4867_1 /TAXON_ID=216777 /ORGANISM="Proboscia alata, Strain PI-D3" /LENGTH=186 /DNA_ID=CAMNT_0039206071 /DNA_START=71 /DNA_END=628 /DNA_ORIENTATION=-
MSYKSNAGSNRDSLFGSPKPKQTYKSNTSSNRDALFGGNAGGAASNRPRPTATQTQAPPQTQTASAAVERARSRQATQSTTSTSFTITSTSRHAPRTTKSLLTLLPHEKTLKMKEAEECRKNAKNAMEKGLFSRPDPIRAGSYYRRAAELYKQCGENRLERLHRIASGDCQMSQYAYATAAVEYMR